MILNHRDTVCVRLAMCTGLGFFNVWGFEYPNIGGFSTVNVVNSLIEWHQLGIPKRWSL